MSETTDTSAIDEKKKESESSKNEDLISNIGPFIGSVIRTFIYIILYFVVSGLMLYICKLSQSNILPTDLKCSPYTDEKPRITNIPINIFTTFTDPPLSMKINFPYNSDTPQANYNASNKILDMFRDYKNQSDSSFLANYLISVFESLIHFNYSIINIIFNLFNGFPETLLLFAGPIMLIFLLIIILLVNQIYIIYSWFANMGWFFKQNTNDSGDGKPVWEDVTLISFFDYGCAWGLVILFAIIFFMAFPIMPIFPLIIVLWCLFSCLSYKAILNGQTITGAKIIQDVFKQNKASIMGVLSLFIILDTFKKLGTVPGLFAVLTLILVYFGIISIGVFTPEKINENLSKVTGYDQAERKKCSNKEHKQEKGLFSFMGGGINIAKELKKVHKKFYSK
jgi:hypothetical protein